MLFPLEGPKLRVGEIINSEPSEKKITARMKTVHSAVKYVEPRPISGGDGEGCSDDFVRIGSQYPVFKTPEEVTGLAKRFYEKAAEISGLDFCDLVHGVFRLEMMLLSKQNEQRRLSRR